MLMSIYIYRPEEILFSGELGFKHAAGLGFSIHAILSP